MSTKTTISYNVSGYKYSMYFVYLDGEEKEIFVEDAGV